MFKRSFIGAQSNGYQRRKDLLINVLLGGCNKTNKQWLAIFLLFELLNKLKDRLDELVNCKSNDNHTKINKKCVLGLKNRLMKYLCVDFIDLGYINWGINGTLFWN